MGFTIDELLVLIICVMGAILAQSFFYKGVFILGSTVGVFTIKRFKKMASGFSLNSFLHWKFGIRLNLPRNWPESWKRFWLP